MIMVEKVAVFFPRMCQKLERFYKSVVEESLLGRYPDVAEDFTSGEPRPRIVRKSQELVRILLH